MFRRSSRSKGCCFPCFAPSSSSTGAEAAAAELGERASPGGCTPDAAFSALNLKSLWGEMVRGAAGGGRFGGEEGGEKWRQIACCTTLM